MTITIDEVRRVAALAKLRLGDEELERMARDLGRILEHVERLRALSLPETPEPPPAAPSLRDDVATTPLEPGVVAANAPAFLRGQFVVPRILGGEE